MPDWTGREKLQGEKEMLGFYVTGHPLDDYGDKIRELATHDTGNLEGLEKGTEVALCGVLTRHPAQAQPRAETLGRDADRRPHRRGRGHGVRRQLRAPGASLIVEDKAVLVTRAGAARRKCAAQDFRAGHQPLETARLNLPSLISIRVWLGRNGVPDKPAALHDLFRAKPGDSQVRLRLEMPRDFSVILDVPTKVRPDREFRAAIEKICGPDCVEVLAG